MIDSEGFRLNVGIVLCNAEGLVFWGRRCGQDSWQFPQGGIRSGESAEEALYRELEEETGLRPEHVELLGRTRGWLRYRIPRRRLRRGRRPTCVGQKQIWFLLRLVGEESAVRLDASPRPEFDRWRWVDYWLPAREVVFFKREVYRQALTELEPYLRSAQAPLAGGRGA